MSLADMEEPLAKRRRFFTEESKTLDDPSVPAATQLDNADTTNIEAQKDIPLEDGDHSAGDDVMDAVSSGFDQSIFESFVGQQVPPDTMSRLREAAGDDVERAVNMFFDGSWKKTATVSAANTAPKSMTINAFTKPKSESANAKNSSTTIPKSPVRNAVLKQSMPEYRYVGAFGVSAWSTKSGANVLQYGDPVRIERQKIQPPKIPVGKGKSKPAQAPKGNTAASRRVDVIVRFTNIQGFEIGRLPREAANWVSTLMDQKVCKFEGTCVYAPERLRTNDTILLQLRCSLLRTAFDNDGFKLPDNRTTGLFEEKETSEEKELRLRQVALVKLFEEVKLLPSRTSETTAKHKREGLLQAAEVAEQYENQKPKKVDSAENGGSSPPSDEVEDGKELEQDQLDTLYKKAQSFDFNAKAAEPADTFAMDLRHYQKQALHWMMSKEQDERDDEREVSMHPLWEEYAWPLKDFDNNDLPQVKDQNMFYVNDPFYIPISSIRMQCYQSLKTLPSFPLIVADNFS